MERKMIHEMKTGIMGMVVSQNLGCLFHFGRPHNKDYSIFGVFMGVPCFEKLPSTPVFTYINLVVSQNKGTPI